MPTSAYPKMKSYAFIGDEYKRFKKKVCLSFDTKSAVVSIIKVKEKQSIAGKSARSSNIGVCPPVYSLISKNNANITSGKPKQKT